MLRRMSDLTGNSQSALVGELLEESQPVFERMVLVLQAAKDVKGKVRADIVASMEEIQQRLEKQLDLGLDAMDVSARPLLQAAEQIQRRGKAGTGEAAKRTPVPDTSPTARTAPMSNRGVTPHANRSKRGKSAVSQRGRRGSV